jgi:peptidoglycan/xylan/chitin deacetylase (PgdA/CDA1 family)
MAGTLVRVLTDVPAVALTFDDGPDPESTPELLDILGTHGAQATFFMIGRNAADHPDIVRRVAAGGHAVGNHTWDHPTMPAISSRERRRQIKACQKALEPYGQRLFRPPHTLQSAASYLTTRGLGYEVVAWGVQAEDWLERSPDWLTTRLVERLAPGRIAVLHDSLWDPVHGAADRGPLLAAVLDTLKELSGQFRFVTVPELMRLGRPVRKLWFYATDDDW